jgi:hypothetical protein
VENGYFGNIGLIIGCTQARGEEKGQVQGLLRQEVGSRQEAGRGTEEHRHQQGGIGGPRVLDVSHMCTPLNTTRIDSKSSQFTKIRKQIFSFFFFARLDFFFRSLLLRA